MSRAKFRHRLRSFYHYVLPWVASVRARNSKIRAGDEVEFYLLDLLTNGDRISFDVGANWGHYSFRLVDMSCRVVAFEPNPRLAYILKKTLPRSAVIKNVAVSSRDGKIRLRVPFNEEGLASVEAMPWKAESEEIEVNTLRLDSLAEHDVGFIKIDVEGHELEVLKGADQTIKRCRPNLLIEAEERHKQGATTALFAYFSARRYEGFFVYRDQLLPISQFNAQEMQCPESVVLGKPRDEIAYVNNFLFLPEEAVDAGLAKAIRLRLQTRKAQFRSRVL